MDPSQTEPRPQLPFRAVRSAEASGSGVRLTGKEGVSLLRFRVSEALKPIVGDL